MKTSRWLQFIDAAVTNAAAQKGPLWWELDLTYIGLLLLSKLRLVWDLKPVPAGFLHSNVEVRS